MSISSIFGSPILLAPSSSSTSSFRNTATKPTKPTTPIVGGGGGGGFGSVSGLVIECSSRPQKKATAHHMKTRPRKTQAWDIKRKPTVYAPLPTLPPDFTIVVSSSGDGNIVDDSATEVVVPPTGVLQAPLTSG